MALKTTEQLDREINALFSASNRCDIHLAKAIKQFINQHNQLLIDYLLENQNDIEKTIDNKVYAVDQILIHIWERFFPDNAHLALVAVGGYGRRELMPHSDIDLIIILSEQAEKLHGEELGQFITFLWDTGLDIGSSVRTIEECKSEASKDVTIITNLMEAHFLHGNKQLFQQMEKVLSVDNMWDKKAFFEAKLEEKNQRYQRYNDASYKLEPNLKESPGGLRDIHNISWVLKRAFNVHNLHEIRNIGFIQQDECEALIDGRNFLWLIRFLLHGYAKRKEDRVLFSYQQILTDALKIEGETLNDRIEHLMQRYFRTITELSRLNELLLQLFREEILFKDKEQIIQKINNRFQVRNGYLETRSNELFKLYPPAILETFVILSSHEEIIGVRADTIRQIRNNLDEINEEFRKDSISNALFIQVFRYPNGLTHQLRRMARYGVLNRYIPAFENVTGRMQYDLFHIYTVDQHTLTVVRNLRRFTIEKHNHEFPDCSAIMQQIPKPEILFLAGLFHDIGKGQKGDHSEIGAIEAKHFAKQHGLSSVDSKLLSWLVANHLKMSLTAQRKDLTDLETIYQFAALVGSVNYLQHLYLLTICDIRATNPEAWSDWKHQLIKDLYNKTLTVLKRGLDNPIDVKETIFEKKRAAIEKLVDMDFSSDEVTELWQTFRKSYFIRYDENEIITHTKAILQHGGKAPLIVFYNDNRKHCSNIFVYTKNTDTLFAIITHCLDKMELNIVDARIIVAKNDYSLFCFSILDKQLNTITDRLQIDKIKNNLLGSLQQPNILDAIQTRKQYHSHKHFKPTMHFAFSTWKKLSVLHISATDAPGLLSVITGVLFYSKIRVHNAKIGTIGEKIDDVFFISTQNNKQLSEKQITSLQQELEKQFTHHYQLISNE